MGQMFLTWSFLSHFSRMCAILSMEAERMVMIKDAVSICLVRFRRTIPEVVVVGRFAEGNKGRAQAEATRAQRQ